MLKKIIIKIHRNHLTMYTVNKIYKVIRTKENIQRLNIVMKELLKKGNFYESII